MNTTENTMNETAAQVNDPIRLSRGDAALMHIASKDADRLSLCGININPESGEIVATNGRMLLKRTSEQVKGSNWNNGEKAIVEPKKIKKGETKLIPCPKTDELEFVKTGTGIINATYPDWERIIPRLSGETAHIKLSLEVLEPLVKFMKEAGEKYIQIEMQLDQVGGRKVCQRPQKVRVGQFDGIIMPCRVD